MNNPPNMVAFGFICGCGWACTYSRGAAASFTSFTSAIRTMPTKHSIVAAVALALFFHAAAFSSASTPLWHRGTRVGSHSVTSNDVRVGPNDRVAVVGASGNVGRLVVLRLVDLGMRHVRAVARDAGKAAGFFDCVAGDEPCEVFSADLKNVSSLMPALRDCDAVLIVTGTTAFPTLAWRGGNTPLAVDAQGVANVIEAWVRSLLGAFLPLAITQQSLTLLYFEHSTTYSGSGQPGAVS